MIFVLTPSPPLQTLAARVTLTEGAAQSDVGGRSQANAAVDALN
jgi:hypothetical protein